MDASLLELLRNSRSDQSEEGTYTHVSFFGPASKWHVKNHDLAHFWKTYCQLIYDKPEGIYGLAEKSLDVMPVLARGSLQFTEVDALFTAYEEDFLLALVYCFQQVLLEYLDITSAGQLLCCVLEWEEGRISTQDGVSIFTTTFALQFPYCRTERPFQIRTLRPRIIQLLRQHKVMDRLKEHPVNQQWDLILDPLVPDTPWPLYGSTRTPTEPKLTLTHLYPQIKLDEDGEIPTRLDPDLELNLKDVFFINNHGHVQDGLVKPSLFAQNDEVNYYLWLPMFLSLHYWRPITVLKPGKSPTPSVSTPSHSSTSTYATMSDDPRDNVVQLLNMLSVERAESDHYWMDVGKALYNIYEGNEEGLNLWISFTERAKHHDANECKMWYPGFNIGNNLTLKTIAWYARKDNYDRYQLEWHKKWCLAAFDKAIDSLTHTDIANALYRVYWLDFVYSSVDKHWYFYDCHRWHKLNEGLMLLNCMSGEFANLFEEYRTQISRTVHESNNPNVKDGKEAMIKKITKLIKDLKSVTPKEKLLKEARGQFHDERFLEKLNVNTDTLGLLNGVIETCDTYAIYRDGKPEDFISKCSSVFYDAMYHWKHPMVEACMKWLRQTFPDEELLNYALKLFASCLKGRNLDKLFVVMTGDGDNSKSMIKKLFEATFGSYSHTFDNSILTTKKGRSNGPTPELALAKDSRVAFLQEPGKDDNLRDGAVKELTGGDTIFARLCGQDGGNFEVQAKIFYLCNTVPMFPNCDQAVRNRLRILPYLSKWVHNPPESEEEQFKQRRFKRDNNFASKIPGMAPAFLWILVQKFSSYRMEGLREPKIITDHTNEYWEETDPVLQFIKETIVFVKKEVNGIAEPDESCKLTIAEIYKEYAYWFRETNPGITVPKQMAVKADLIERWGKPTRLGWYGVKFKHGAANEKDANFVEVKSGIYKGKNPLGTSPTINKEMRDTKEVATI